MSRRGNGWDNAVVESFFASLKKERVYRTTYTTGKQALHDVSDYIGWYNHQRMHSTNDNYSPVEYENQWVKAMQALDKKWAICSFFNHHEHDLGGSKPVYPIRLRPLYVFLGYKLHQLVCCECNDAIF